jgi:type IV secretion system protein VirB4
MFGAASSARPSPRYWERAGKESNVGEFVSIGAPLTQHDTATRSGDCLRVWRIDGVAFESAEFNLVKDRHDAWCNVLRNLPAGRTAVYHHRIHRRIHDRLTDASEPDFSAAFSKAYQDRIGAAPMMSNELYITLLYRPAFDNFASELARRSARGSKTKQSLSDQQGETLAAMEQQGALIERSLREFGPTLLGCYEQDGQLFWESGELFSFLINGVWRKVRFPTGPAYQTLPDAHLTFGGGMLEIRQGERRRYASMLSIKEFAGQVEPGTLGALLYEDSEYIETQSFSSLPRRQAMAALTTQRDQLLASDDAVVTQIDAMDVALDQLGDGQFVMGEYSYTLAVFGDTLDECGKRAASAVGALTESTAMELVPVDLVADAAWFSQQPGNFQWRPRKATISSRAFAALTCGHNFLRGKRDGNPWGEALALMRTPAGNPFYLNLHASPEGEDSEGKKLPGNTIVIGSTGSGKTTLLTGLLALTPKWPVRPRVVSFSLDRDTEIVIRALGGVFYTFERNEPTGCNPFQREATPERLGFWTELVKQCIGSPEMPLLPNDHEAIARAVATVAALKPELRWFSTVRQSLPRSGANSLYDRLGKWCRGGELGWVFDMADDRLGDLRSHMAIGFDYTGVLSSPDVRTPIMMYLLNVMDELVNGEPMIYHVAECWKALGDPAFAPFVKHKQKTIRKMNGLGLFDTQEVSDLLSNENGRTMIEQSVTKLVLPNADADRDEYVGGLGLTDAEFNIVRSLGAIGSRRFLCKQGRDSVQCEFDLGGMDDFLAVLSSTTDNVDLLEQLRSEVGDDPRTWLPLFYKRVRDRRNFARRAA